MSPRILAALASALLLALSFPLTLPPLPTAVQAQLPPLPADPALGSFTIPGLPTADGFIQFPALAFVALVPLLLAVRAARRPLQAALLGLLCGSVWLVLTLLWLRQFGLLPVLLLAGYFALPLGLFTWLSWRLIELPAKPGLAVLRQLWAVPLLWVAIEYVRSFGLWAFPWNLLGYTQAAYPLLLQTADLGGVYAVSFLIALANALVVTLLSATGTARQRLRQGALAGLLVLLALGYGWWRVDTFAKADATQAQRDAALLKLDPRQPTVHPSLPVSFALVQGGVSSLEEYSDETYDKTMKAYAGTTRVLLGQELPASPWRQRPAAGSAQAVSPAAQVPAQQMGPQRANPSSASSVALVRPEQTGKPRPQRMARLPATPVLTPAATVAAPEPAPLPAGDLLLVWPEGSISKYDGIDARRLHTVPGEMRRLVQGSEPRTLLAGVLGKPRRDNRGENGCILIDAQGNVSWPYSKIRLVPYGEVTPFRGILEFLDFPWNFGDLDGGRAVQTLDWRGHRLGLLICFDNVFPFISRIAAQRGARHLVLMTNNSWYPMRSGIRQHCDMDALRAVETRRPLLRCSTTGWSQVVDRSGRVVQTTRQMVGTPQTLVSSVPGGSGSTVYMTVGDLFAQLCLVATLLLLAPVLLVGRSEGFL